MHVFPGLELRRCAIEGVSVASVLQAMKKDVVENIVLLSRDTASTLHASASFVASARCAWQHSRPTSLSKAFCLRLRLARLPRANVGSCSEANYLKRNSAMDDSIGGS